MSAQDRLRGQMVTALRQHLASGKPPRVPVAGHVLWHIFAELSESRTNGGFAPNPISDQEIAAWCHLNRTRLQRHHIETLKAMDREWRNKPDEQPKANLTVANFDAFLT